MGFFFSLGLGEIFVHQGKNLLSGWNFCSAGENICYQGKTFVYQREFVFIRVKFLFVRGKYSSGWNFCILKKICYQGGKRAWGDQVSMRRLTDTAHKWNYNSDQNASFHKFVKIRVKEWVLPRFPSDIFSSALNFQTKMH